jgi:hypothetical protein
VTGRPTASTINDTQLDQLYDELAALRQVARGYCPACGRGDAAPTVTDWEQQKQRADQLATVLTEVLGRLHPLTRWGGSVIGHQTVGVIHPETHARWQAALDQNAGHYPAATQATKGRQP